MSAVITATSVAFNPPTGKRKRSQAANPAEPNPDPLLTTVPARAALEIAEGSRSPYDVLSSFGYDESQIEFLCQHKPFLMQVERYRAELQKSGYTFRSKASFLAEQHLETTHRIIVDDQTPANVRLDAIKFLAKMGNLEPKENAAGGGANGVSVTINLGGDTKPVIINGE